MNSSSSVEDYDRLDGKRSVNWRAESVVMGVFINLIDRLARVQARLGGRKPSHRMVRIGNFGLRRWEVENGVGVAEGGDELPGSPLKAPVMTFPN